MSRLAEIVAALPALTKRELLAADVDRQFRERKGALIRQDAHGLETEADLLVAADRAFQEYDAPRNLMPNARRGEVWQVDLGLAAGSSSTGGQCSVSRSGTRCLRRHSAHHRAAATAEQLTAIETAVRLWLGLK